MGILTTIFLFLSGQCTDIVDIYYHKGEEQFAYDGLCRFTKTEVCDTCPEYNIHRASYNEWAQEFVDLGLKVPYSKREDKDHLFEPVVRNIF